MSAQPVPRSSANPFSTTGITREEAGIAHYDSLPSSLVAVLDHWARTTPDAEAVVEVGGPRLTYRQLLDSAARVSGGLLAGGLAPGDRVALRQPNGVDWVLAFWGTLLAGGVPVAVNTRFTAVETVFVLADAGVSVDLAPGAPLPDAAPAVAPPPAHSDLAALFYTSGTTGSPKGVLTTHEAFLSNAETMIRCLGVSRDVGAELRTLVSVPLFHVTGCNSQLLTAAYVGGTAVILPALDLGRLLAVVAQERITFLVTVPAVYALLLRHPDLPGADVSSVRWVGYGGAPIAASLVRQLTTAFPRCEVFNGYGMTETASLMTVLPHRDAADHADSVGFAVPVVDLAVAAGDRPGRGELLARGPNITAGYWGQPAATAEALAGGWLHTGDVVEVDADGRLTVVDRLKDIIIRGGENVSSIEVESALADAPGVAEAAALAVADVVMGERVGVVLVGVGDDVDVDAVLAHARTRLAPFKLPEHVVVRREPLPRNAGGKVRKTELRKDVVWGERRR